MQDYRVQLDIFAGPLDLLLYLIRRSELDIQDVALAQVTSQYLDYVRVLEQLEPNSAGEFLVLASTLVEMKSRALLPTPPLESDADDSTGSSELVRQLLEYKRFKDAARALGSAAEERAMRYVRRPAALPPELQGVEMEDVEVWDLVSAFGRVMSQIGQGPGAHAVLYDDVPLEERIGSLLSMLERGAARFGELFHPQASRAEIVGNFLALLELIRRRRVRVEQPSSRDEIYLFLLDEVDEPELMPAESVEGASPPAADAPVDGPEFAHADFNGSDATGANDNEQA